MNARENIGELQPKQNKYETVEDEGERVPDGSDP